MTQWAFKSYISFLFSDFYFYFLNLDTSKEVVPENQGRANTSELESPTLPSPREGKETAPHPGKEQHNQSTSKQPDINVSRAFCF